MASSKKRWGDHRCGVSVNARKSHFVCVCFGTLPSVWTLSSQTRDLTRAKAVKVSSPNHRPTREFLQRICFAAQQAGRPGAGFCPVPALGPDQQGAPEANEWQAGEGAQDPTPPTPGSPFRRQGSFTLQAPKPSRIFLCPHRGPPPKCPASPGAQRGRASRAHRSQASCSQTCPAVGTSRWVRQVDRPKHPDRGPAGGAGSDLNCVVCGWAWALLCPSHTRSAEGPGEDLARAAE